MEVSFDFHCWLYFWGALERFYRLDILHLLPKRDGRNSPNYLVLAYGLVVRCAVPNRLHACEDPFGDGGKLRLLHDVHGCFRRLPELERFSSAGSLAVPHFRLGGPNDGEFRTSLGAEEECGLDEAEAACSFVLRFGFPSCAAPILELGSVV